MPWQFDDRVDLDTSGLIAGDNNSNSNDQMPTIAINSNNGSVYTVIEDDDDDDDDGGGGGGDDDDGDNDDDDNDNDNDDEDDNDDDDDDDDDENNVRSDNPLFEPRSPKQLPALHRKQYHPFVYEPDVYNFFSSLDFASLTTLLAQEHFSTIQCDQCSDIIIAYCYERHCKMKHSGSKQTVISVVEDVITTGSSSGNDESNDGAVAAAAVATAMSMGDTVTANVEGMPIEEAATVEDPVAIVDMNLDSEATSLPLSSLPQPPPESAICDGNDEAAAVAVVTAAATRSAVDNYDQLRTARIELLNEFSNEELLIMANQYQQHQQQQPQQQQEPDRMSNEEEESQMGQEDQQIFQDLMSRMPDLPILSQLDDAFRIASEVMSESVTFNENDNELMLNFFPQSSMMPIIEENEESVAEDEEKQPQPESEQQQKQLPANTVYNVDLTDVPSATDAPSSMPTTAIDFLSEFDFYEQPEQGDDDDDGGKAKSSKDRNSESDRNSARKALDNNDDAVASSTVVALAAVPSSASAYFESFYVSSEESSHSDTDREPTDRVVNAEREPQRIVIDCGATFRSDLFRDAATAASDAMASTSASPAAMSTTTGPVTVAVLPESPLLLLPSLSASSIASAVAPSQSAAFSQSLRSVSTAQSNLSGASKTRMDVAVVAVAEPAASASQDSVSVAAMSASSSRSSSPFSFFSCSSPPLSITPMPSTSVSPTIEFEHQSLVAAMSVLSSTRKQRRRRRRRRPRLRRRPRQFQQTNYAARRRDSHRSNRRGRNCRRGRHSYRSGRLHMRNQRPRVRPQLCRQIFKRKNCKLPLTQKSKNEISIEPQLEDSKEMSENSHLTQESEYESQSDLKPGPEPEPESEPESTVEYESEINSELEFDLSRSPQVEEEIVSDNCHMDGDGDYGEDDGDYGDDDGDYDEDYDDYNDYKNDENEAIAAKSPFEYKYRPQQALPRVQRNQLSERNPNCLLKHSPKFQMIFELFKEQPFEPLPEEIKKCMDLLNRGYKVKELKKLIEIGRLMDDDVSLSDFEFDDDDDNEDDEDEEEDEGDDDDSVDEDYSGAHLPPETSISYGWPHQSATVTEPCLPSMQSTMPLEQQQVSSVGCSCCSNIGNFEQSNNFRYTNHFEDVSDASEQETSAPQDQPLLSQQPQQPAPPPPPPPPPIYEPISDDETSGNAYETDRPLPTAASTATDAFDPQSPPTMMPNIAASTKTQKMDKIKIFILHLDVNRLQIKITYYDIIEKRFLTFEFHCTTDTLLDPETIVNFNRFTDTNCVPDARYSIRSFRSVNEFYFCMRKLKIMSHESRNFYHYFVEILRSLRQTQTENGSIEDRCATENEPLPTASESVAAVDENDSSRSRQMTPDPFSASLSSTVSDDVIKTEAAMAEELQSQPQQVTEESREFVSSSDSSIAACETADVKEEMEEEPVTNETNFESHSASAADQNLMIGATSCSDDDRPVAEKSVENTENVINIDAVAAAVTAAAASTEEDVIDIDTIVDKYVTTLKQSLIHELKNSLNKSKTNNLANTSKEIESKCMQELSRLCSSKVTAETADMAQPIKIETNETCAAIAANDTDKDDDDDDDDDDIMIIGAFNRDEEPIDIAEFRPRRFEFPTKIEPDRETLEDFKRFVPEQQTDATIITNCFLPKTNLICDTESKEHVIDGNNRCHLMNSASADIKHEEPEITATNMSRNCDVSLRKFPNVVIEEIFVEDFNLSDDDDDDVDVDGQLRSAIAAEKSYRKVGGPVTKEEVAANSANETEPELEVIEREQSYGSISVVTNDDDEIVARDNHNDGTIDLTLDSDDNGSYAIYDDEYHNDGDDENDDADYYNYDYDYEHGNANDNGIDDTDDSNGDLFRCDGVHEDDQSFNCSCYLNPSLPLIRYGRTAETETTVITVAAADSTATDEAVTTDFEIVGKSKVNAAGGAGGIGDSRSSVPNTSTNQMTNDLSISSSESYSDSEIDMFLENSGRKIDHFDSDLYSESESVANLSTTAARNLSNSERIEMLQIEKEPTKEVTAANSESNRTAASKQEPPIQCKIDTSPRVHVAQSTGATLTGDDDDENSDRNRNHSRAGSSSGSKTQNLSLVEAIDREVINYYVDASRAGRATKRKRKDRYDKTFDGYHYVYATRTKRKSSSLHARKRKLRREQQQSSGGVQPPAKRRRIERKFRQELLDLDNEVIAFLEKHANFQLAKYRSYNRLERLHILRTVRLLKYFLMKTSPTFFLHANAWEIDQIVHRFETYRSVNFRTIRSRIHAIQVDPIRYDLHKAKVNHLFRFLRDESQIPHNLITLRDIEHLNEKLYGRRVIYRPEQ